MLIVESFELIPLTGKVFVTVNGFCGGSWLDGRFVFIIWLFSNRDTTAGDCWSSDSLIFSTSFVSSFHIILPVFFLWLCTRFVRRPGRFNESLAIIVEWSSVRELILRDKSLLISFLSSIIFCKRSVSISCSLLVNGVDGAPILLFDNSFDSFERFLICCSAAFISSAVTLCVERRSRLAWAERCLRCASASSSRFVRLFESSIEFAVDDDDVTVTFVVVEGGGGGKELVTLTTVDGVDSLIPRPDRRRTYGPVLFCKSPTVRSVVPHLNKLLD